MSDTLTRAKKLVAQHEASGYIHRDATLLLPELVAECEFWRQKAIEEHAMKHQYFLEEDQDMMKDAWQKCGDAIRKECREQAERELEMMR